MRPSLSSTTSFLHRYLPTPLLSKWNLFMLALRRHLSSNPKHSTFSHEQLTEATVESPLFRLGEFDRSPGSACTPNLLNEVRIWETNATCWIFFCMKKRLSPIEHFLYTIFSRFFLQFNAFYSPIVFFFFCCKNKLDRLIKIQGSFFRKLLNYFLCFDSLYTFITGLAPCD
jgi:hypothetical protein